MRKGPFAVGSLLGLAAAASLALAADPVKSGPQPGQPVPGPFYPLNITGTKAGQKNCLYCQNGDHPVAMIFAREASAPVLALIKKIDACTAKHQDSEMGSFAVFLSDEEDMPKQLKELAEKDNIKHTVLGVDSPTGPRAYKIARDADVTVVLYTHRTVKANYAFPKGDLNQKAINRIVADVGKILPKD